VTGYTREEVIGRHTRLLKSGKQGPAFYRELWETITAGRVWSGCFVNRRKDGTLYEEEATISAIRDDAGQIASFVAVKRDVTRQRALEKQLGEAQKLESIGQLAAGIAHEINTPTQYVGDNTRFLQESFRDLLEPLRATLRLFEQSPDGPPPAEALRALHRTIAASDLEYLAQEIPRAIEQSLEGVERVTKIVRAMKEFSHPGEEKTLLDLNKAIETTLTVARNEWKYVAEVVTDFDESLGPVPCIPGGFNQVVLNMVVNAAHAIADAVGGGGERKGSIRITTRRLDGWAEVRIADTGSGIPESIRGRIFDPFFTTKEVGKGTGQGLSIAHNIVVQKHGGTIDFESETGLGTTFTVRLPLEDPASAAKELSA
jgi:PAS domain S-box-containing protein